MRVAFAGTPAFASPALEAIAAAHDVPLVLTQPDRPAGRGMKLSESDVATVAGRIGLRVSKPASLRTDEALAELRSAAPDVLVVAAYGLLLPKAVLELPRYGCINIHASLLPRWRGAAPVHRALLAGDTETGICIMRMEEGLDTGPILLARRVEIGARDTAGSLTQKLSRLGAEAVIDALGRLEALEPRAQDSERATYAAKVGKRDGVIDWSLPADYIDRQVRAFNPSPGAEGVIGAMRIKVWDAEPISGAYGAPGSVVRSVDGLAVACGQGALRLRSVQRPGGRRMPVAEFIRGGPWADPSPKLTS